MVEHGTKARGGKSAVRAKLGSVEGWQVKALWKEYETIAMHFNDLLIKLRTQALGVVAAISALIGVFGKSGATDGSSWQVATLAFFILCMFWIAIWVIDFCYYNRLLIGAVDAILELEELSKTTLYIQHINISTKIENAVIAKRSSGKLNVRDKIKLSIGRWAFYIIVFIALLVGLYISYYHK